MSAQDRDRLKVLHANHGPGTASDFQKAAPTTPPPSRTSHQFLERRRCDSDRRESATWKALSSAMTYQSGTFYFKRNFSLCRDI
jgi:hypothetical protein